MNAVEEKRKLTYIPSLDGLRGLFCILIIMNHWDLLLPISPVGWEVLQAFFVMSGFLITRILIHDRDKHASFRSYIKSFYIKRTLRIFPLYFIFLFFWLAVRLIMANSEFIQKFTDELVQNWAWYFTYTSNLKYLFVPPEGTDPRFFEHLWSLGLEEQFYLVMPFIIFFLRGNWLKGAVIAFILIPMVTRPLGYYLLNQADYHPLVTTLLVYRNLPFQCDAFAFGAAVAIFDFDFIKHPKRWFYFLLVVMLGLNAYHFTLFGGFGEVLLQQIEGTSHEVDPSLLSYIFWLGRPELLGLNQQHVYMMPLINLMCFFMVLTSVRGNTLWPKLFENKLIVDVGRVTYGMYVFHFFVIIVFIKAATTVLGPAVRGNVLLHIPLFAVYLVILYYMSKFSFLYIEGPFLKLKNKIK